MKRLAIVLAGVLLLSGCTATTEPAAQPSEGPTFVDQMRATKGFFGATDQELIDVGQSVCDALEDGTTYDEAVHFLTVGGLEKDQAEDVVFISAEEYCPAEAG